MRTITLGSINPRQVWSRILITFLGLLSIGLILITPVQAAVIADHSLPEDTVVVKTSEGIIVKGGTQVGSARLHSFAEFSPDDGTQVIFQSSDRIRQFLCRVTGAGSSLIDSPIEQTGSADFILLNPDGLTFGSNARLPHHGSFVATTAASLSLGNRLFPARSE